MTKYDDAGDPYISKNIYCTYIYIYIYRYISDNIPVMTNKYIRMFDDHMGIYE